MDPENALKSEVFKPIVTTIVPGIISITSFLAIANYYHPSLAEQFENHPIISVSIAVALIIAAGHIAEDLGSQYEVFIWNRIANQTDRNYWYKYLKTATLKDTPAEAYIRDVVLRMKFEASLAASLFSFIFGYTWLFYLNTLDCHTYFSTLIPTLLLIAYLLFECRCGIRLLMETREELLK